LVSVVPVCRDICLRMYLDVNEFCLQDSKSDERFHVELHFSPGVYTVGQNKEYLAGRGYRPQHGEKKQVPNCVIIHCKPL